MGDGADLEGNQSTDADFDRLQDELDDVGSQLATLKQQAEHLLAEAQNTPTVSPGLDGQ